MLTIDSARYFKALQSKEVLDVSDGRNSLVLERTFNGEVVTERTLGV